MHKGQSDSGAEICPSINPLHTLRKNKIFTDNVCPALANAQRAAGDEPKTFALSYRDLRLVHCVGAAIPPSLPEPRPQSHETGDCKSGHSGRWEIYTAKILPEFFLCSFQIITLALLAHLGQN